MSTDDEDRRDMLARMSTAERESFLIREAIDGLVDQVAELTSTVKEISQTLEAIYRARR